jgi:hypothetical protein
LSAAAADFGARSNAVLAPGTAIRFAAGVSDRLNELQRQRALLQEHLAWLEREIAAATGGLITPPVARPAPATPPPPPASRAHAEAAAEEILSQYKDDTVSTESSVKRGCFLYFFLAFLLVGLGVAALYFHATRK